MEPGPSLHSLDHFLGELREAGARPVPQPTPALRSVLAHGFTAPVVPLPVGERRGQRPTSRWRRTLTVVVAGASMTAAGANVAAAAGLARHSSPGIVGAVVRTFVPFGTDQEPRGRQGAPTVAEDGAGATTRSTPETSGSRADTTSSSSPVTPGGGTEATGRPGPPSPGSVAREPTALPMPSPPGAPSPALPTVPSPEVTPPELPSTTVPGPSPTVPALPSLDHDQLGR